MSKIPEHNCPRCEVWKKLVEAKDLFLVAYRIGRPPTEKAWKMLESAKKKLGLED